MEDLLIQFGYVAVFLGTFLEGETILALAGLAAANGYLSFAGVERISVVRRRGRHGGDRRVPR
jgi:membrane protein DedA with SNARE-associated domain